MLFVFRIFPICAVKASWVWINFSTQQEQEQTFVFICSRVEQGQGSFEVISECMAFTISCVSLPSHGWIIHGYPAPIFRRILHQCSGQHHLPEFLPLWAQPNTTTPSSQRNSGVCLFTPALFQQTQGGAGCQKCHSLGS